MDHATYRCQDQRWGGCPFHCCSNCNGRSELWPYAWSSSGKRDTSCWSTREMWGLVRSSGASIAWAERRVNSHARPKPLPSSFDPTISKLATPSHSLRAVLSADYSHLHMNIGIGPFSALKTPRPLNSIFRNEPKSGVWMGFGGMMMVKPTGKAMKMGF